MLNNREIKLLSRARTSSASPRRLLWNDSDPCLHLSCTNMDKKQQIPRFWHQSWHNKCLWWCSICLTIHLIHHAVCSFRLYQSFNPRIMLPRKQGRCFKIQPAAGLTDVWKVCYDDSTEGLSSVDQLHRKIWSLGEFHFSGGDLKGNSTYFLLVLFIFLASVMGSLGCNSIVLTKYVFWSLATQLHYFSKQQQVKKHVQSDDQTDVFWIWI